ncbi:MAG: hypothetical protein GY805_25290 [Chloroflexi bacterium]|nr:hypothetical protein [Chloroflexota bacterium]
MTQASPAQSSYISGALGLFVFLFGLIISISYVFHWSEYFAYRDGVTIEGTIAAKGEFNSGDRWVSVTFVEDGQQKTWQLEAVNEQTWLMVSEGEKVVALQMKNSPSRLILADNLDEIRPPWVAGLSLSGVVIIGLLSIIAVPFLQKKGWHEKRLLWLDRRLFSILLGGIFTFVGIAGLVSSVGESNGRLGSLLCGGSLGLAFILIGFFLIFANRSYV